MTRLPTPSAATRATMAQQHTAHDILDLLIAQRGAVDVLHLLRYWYVVAALGRDTARRPPAPR